MSPLGIQRTVAVLLIISPWVYIPGIFKEFIFIVAGILLFVSTLDLKKKPKVPRNEETESIPHSQESSHEQNA
ncbi:MAG: hypothetical protein KBC50_03560 [Candidatus Pacebacteria bacterium]|jgi:hypothetical protein|nr:hypothetical protein [Candidatus Paceibacterota bacterium]